MDVQTLVDRAGSVVKLADIAGVSRTTVLDWKRTGFLPGARIHRISKKLGIPLEQVARLVRPAGGNR